MKKELKIYAVTLNSPFPKGSTPSSEEGFSSFKSSGLSATSFSKGGIRHRMSFGIRYLLLVPVIGYLFPFFASAQQKIEIFTNPNRGLTFIGLANKLQGVANAIIPFLVGLAVVAIIWGIFKYVKSAGDAEKVAEGRKTIVYGIVALFIMLGFWGLVIAITTSLFGV